MHDLTRHERPDAVRARVQVPVGVQGLLRFDHRGPGRHRVGSDDHRLARSLSIVRRAGTVEPDQPFDRELVQHRPCFLARVPPRHVRQHTGVVHQRDQGPVAEHRDDEAGEPSDSNFVVEGLGQRLCDLREKRELALGQPGLRRRDAQGDLATGGGRQDPEHLDVVVRPLPGLGVDDAERAQRLRVLGHQREPGPGLHPHRLDGRVVGREWVGTGVAGDQWLTRRDDVLAERFPDGVLGGAVRPEPDPGLPERPLRVDDRDERERCAEQPRGERCEIVERRLGVGVEQAGLDDRAQARRIVDRGPGRLRHGARIGPVARKRERYARQSWSSIEYSTPRSPRTWVNRMIRPQAGHSRSKLSLGCTGSRCGSAAAAASSRYRGGRGFSPARTPAGRRRCLSLLGMMEV